MHKEHAKREKGKSRGAQKGLLRLPKSRVEAATLCKSCERSEQTSITRLPRLVLRSPGLLHARHMLCPVPFIQTNQTREMRIKARINEEGGEDKEGRHKKVRWRRGRGAGHPAVTVEIVGRSDLGRHMAGRQQTHGLPTRCIVILDQLMVHSTTTSTSTSTNNVTYLPTKRHLFKRPLTLERISSSFVDALFKCP